MSEAKVKGKAKKATAKEGKVKKVPSKSAVKRKAKSHALAVKENPSISKTNTSALTSILGDSAEAIHQLLESNEGDSARSLVYKKILQATIDLLPLVEQNIRDSSGSKGVYQYTTLVTNIRELFIDIQSAQDRGRIGEIIIERIIRPAMMDIGMASVQGMAMIENDAKNYMSPQDFKRFKEDVTRQRDVLADAVMKSYRTIETELLDYLQR